MVQLARSLATLALAISLAGCAPAGPAGSPQAPADSSPAAAASPDPSASPSASDATAAEMQQIVAQAMSAPVDLSDPGPALDRVEQGMTNSMRQAAGVAELMGPNGGAILAGIDTTERELIAAVVARMRAGAPATGIGAPVFDVALPPGPAIPARLANVVSPRPPGTTAPGSEVGGESLFGAFLITMLAPGMLSGAEGGASGGKTLTQEAQSADGSKLRFTITPTLAGSKLTAEVRIDIEMAGPLAHTEHASGKVTMDACPDAGGNVPLEVSLGGGFSMLGGGMQYEVNARATGHVDDNGNLASMDLAFTGSLASQPMTGSSALGTAPMFVEIAVTRPVGGQGTVQSPRQSSRWTREFVTMGADMTRSLGTLAATSAMDSAERAWTTGYCVAITVPEMDDHTKIDDPRGRVISMGVQLDAPSTMVTVGSEKPFSAVVTHKFEAGQLHAPVTAILNSGAVSVTPSGTKVPAPAPFRYKAPDETYVNAVVTLETRSRRGVAMLFVVFRTVPKGYRASWQDQGATWSGLVCGLDRQFTVTVLTQGGDLEVPFEFEPTSPTAGTVSFDVTKYKTHWMGSGTYAVTGPDAEHLSLVGRIRNASYNASGKTGYYDIPFNVPLTPLSGKECG